MLGIGLAILMASFGSVTQVLTRRLKELPVAIIMFYHGLFGMTSAALYILFEGLLSD